VNGVGEIGLDGGIRGVSHSQRGSMTPSVESRKDSRVIARPGGFRSVYERKSKKRKLSMLVVCAATVALLAAFAYGPLGLEEAVWGVHTQDTTPPVANFTATVSGGFHVLVNASASTSTNGIASYSWYFGDWITSVGKYHNHSYVTSGKYNITLNVTDTIGLYNTTTRQVTVTNGNPPPFPYIVYGTTFQSDGVTALPFCKVTVTDVVTVETIIGSNDGGLFASDVDGAFTVDISPLLATSGDGLVVNAVSPGGAETGSNTGTVDTSVPYVNINVTLSPTAIPEFTTLMVPIAGLISIFVIMRMASARVRK
jgi:hypothetical protein